MVIYEDTDAGFFTPENSVFFSDDRRPRCGFYFRTLFARTTTSPDFTARTGDSTMLVPVTTSVWGMEYSVHACPKKHRAEAEAMFPGLDVSDLLVIPTCQVRFRNQQQP